MTRDKVIRMRVTEEEKKEVEARAKALGLNVSEYMRMLIIVNERKQEENK